MYTHYPPTLRNVLLSAVSLVFMLAALLAAFAGGYGPIAAMVLAFAAFVFASFREGIQVKEKPPLSPLWALVILVVVVACAVAVVYQMDRLGYFQ